MALPERSASGSRNGFAKLEDRMRNRGSVSSISLACLSSLASRSVESFAPDRGFRGGPVRWILQSLPMDRRRERADLRTSQLDRRSGDLAPIL